jgi:hypothetical protein
MSTTTANGRSQRTSLAQQIDRLDLILDNLSEGLQEAVAEAVKVAVTRAVEAALVEVLTNAELRRHLMPVPPVARANAAETVWARAARFALGCRQSARMAAGGLWSAVRAVSGKALDAGQRVSQQVQRRLMHFVRLIRRGGGEAVSFLRQVWRSLAVALGFGLVVGVGCFLAGPVVASAVSGLAGFVGSLATVLRCRRQFEHADRVQDFNDRLL